MRKTVKKLYARTFQHILKLFIGMLLWKTPEILEGAGCVTKLPKKIKENGKRKALIVTGSVLIGMGALDNLLKAMQDSGLEYVIYSGVKPNPTDIDVSKGLKRFKENNCDCFIAFGGGSPMDCCKAIAALSVKKGKRIENLQGMFKVRKKTPPIFAVPTTSGSGSETTIAAVITIHDTHHKASINDICLMPKLAVLDPELTVNLPPASTAATGMDALTHAIEAYTNHTYNSDLENKLAEGAVRLIYNNLYKAYCDGSDIEARQNMQKSAFYAGRAFTRGCVGYVHAIGHTLGGLYGTPHGFAMAVILPHVLRQFGPAVYERLARLAEVCEMTGKNDAEKAEKFIKWIEDLKEKMNIPMTLDVIKDDDIPQMINWAVKEANPFYPTPVYWEKEDFKRLIDTIRK